jgi:hypothetical protein
MEGAVTQPNDDPAMLEGYLVRLNGKAWGMALGVLFGLGLFLPTMVLALRGGENVGDMLNRLALIFPYYEVSIGGAFLGAVYGFFVGQIVGRLFCAVYNKTAKS